MTTTNLNNERLALFINSPLDNGLTRSEQMEIASELLALREAAEKPVAEVVSWNHPTEERKCDIRWLRFDVEPGHLYAAPQLPAVPDGLVLVPNSLSAENGAKACLSGEFVETKFISCPECLGDDDCESCDGSGLIKIEVPVSWTTIKAIWAKGVEHFTTAQPPADTDSATAKAGEPKK